MTPAWHRVDYLDTALEPRDTAGSNQLQWHQDVSGQRAHGLLGTVRSG